MESNCIPKSKVLRFDGVAARTLNQLEPNGAKQHFSGNLFVGNDVSKSHAHRIS
jgi:hypothetical protein